MLVFLSIYVSELINHCRGSLHQAVLHSPPPCIYPHVFNETWSFHQLISKLFGSSCQSRIIYSVSKLLSSIQNYIQCFKALIVNPELYTVSKLLLSIQNYIVFPSSYCQSRIIYTIIQCFQVLIVNPELSAVFPSS